MRKIALLLITIFAFTMLGCGKPAKYELPKDVESKEVVDASGKVRIAVNPRRIVVLGNGSLSTLVYLGIRPSNGYALAFPVKEAPDFIKKILGNKELTMMCTDVGSFNNLDMKKIRDFKPDLIITSRKYFKESVYDELASITSVLDFSMENNNFMDACCRNIHEIGEIFPHTRSNANGMIEEIVNRYNWYKKSDKFHTPNGMFILVVKDDGIYTTGSTHRFGWVYTTFLVREIFNTSAVNEELVKIPTEEVRKLNPVRIMAIDNTSDVGKFNGHISHPDISSTRAGSTQMIVKVDDPNMWMYGDYDAGYQSFFDYFKDITNNAKKFNSLITGSYRPPNINMNTFHHGN